MGLLDSFTVNPVKEAGGWEYAMTDADVDEMEKKGCDVTELRAKRAARAKELAMQEVADNAAFAEQRAATAVKTDVKKLEPYFKTPRDTAGAFFTEAAGKPPLFGLFGKDKWITKMANAPIIYGAVVQANADLWVPGDNDYYPAVFVFALDEAHIHDTGWLAKTAQKIAEIQESDSVPADCAEMIDVMRDQQSEFCFPVGSSIAGGADAWCVTWKFEKQSALPGKRLPEDGIVPFFLEDKPKKQMPVQLKLIPAKFYS